MNEPTVPRSAERILEAMGADSYLNEVVLGDLTEEFAGRVSWDGAAAARRWYLRETLRVAPYLLREWWRDHARGQAIHLAAAIGVASAVMLAFERALGVGLHIVTALSSPALPLVLLAWTTADGMLAGYVAARLGKRAPVPTVLALTAAWSIVMVVMMGAPSPGWFRAASVVAMAGGIVAGGVLRVCGWSRWSASQLVG